MGRSASPSGAGITRRSSEVVCCVTATRVVLSMCHLTASASGCSHAVAGVSVVGGTFYP